MTTAFPTLPDLVGTLDELASLYAQRAAWCSRLAAQAKPWIAEGGTPTPEWHRDCNALAGLEGGGGAKGTPGDLHDGLWFDNECLQGKLVYDRGDWITPMRAAARKAVRE